MVRLALMGQQFVTVLRKKLLHTKSVTGGEVEGSDDYIHWKLKNIFD